MHLKLFQKIVLMLMAVYDHMVYIASRGCGKSFLIAIFCCYKAILYPGTKIIIASGTRDQAVNVLEKIKTELKPLSPYLCAEIKNDTLSTTKAQIDFYNGSFIKVVTASDSARGSRANVLICDEFRMIKKSVIDEVLKKFLTNPRHPGYLNKPEYAHLQETNKEYYLSSAFFKSHWSYAKSLDFAKRTMDDSKKYFACGFPYQLPLEEGIYMREQIEDEMSEATFSELKWNMEMLALWFGDDEGSFFNFDDIDKNRQITHVWLPPDMASKLGDVKFKAPPKQANELRVLSADIALMPSKRHNNDAASLFINSMVASRGGRYMNNIMYTQNYEGELTDSMALIIRKCFDDFACDYIVLDVKSAGLGVYDMLIRDIADPETGVIYPALSCCNDDVYASRCKVPGAAKVIWVINGSARLNSECAIHLRDSFRSGRVRIPVSEYDAEQILGEVRGYGSKSPEEKMRIQLPYINTTLLINELINLQHDDSSGYVRVYEKANMRKDRYSSLSYNLYVASQLELELSKPKNSVPDSSYFAFKRPVTGGRR